MKTRLRTVNDHGVTYDALMFVCPGCKVGGPEGYEGLHMLPVNSENHTPSWNWNGDLEHPTLEPSVLTRGYSLCHSYLRNGKFEFLTDSEHPLSGQTVDIPDLPEWAAELYEEDGELTDE